MEIIQDNNQVFEFYTKLQDGVRAAILFLALLPLGVPYELLIKPHWGSPINFFFLFAAILSLGAVTLSGFLVWGAISGLNIKLSFNKIEKTFTYTLGAPVVRWGTETVPFEQIDSLEIETQDWNDRPTTYALVIRLKNGKIYKTGSTDSEEQAAEILEKTRHSIER